MSKSQVQLWGKDTYDFPPAPPATCVPDPYYSCGPTWEEPSFTYVWGAGSNVVSTSTNFNGTLLRAGTNSTDLVYSLDNGVTFTFGTVGGSGWSKIATSPTHAVIVPNSGLATRNTTDGVNWSASGNLPSSGVWHACQYGNGKFFAVRYNSTAAAESTDNGATWVSRTINVSRAWRDVCYSSGDNRWVVAAENSASLSVSTNDGVTWVAGPSFVSMTSCVRLTYDQGRMIATPFATGTFINVWIDGEASWRAVRLPIDASTGIGEPKWTGTHWVLNMSGGAYVLVSLDALSWDIVYVPIPFASFTIFTSGPEYIVYEHTVGRVQRFTPISTSPGRTVLSLHLDSRADLLNLSAPLATDELDISGNAIPATLTSPANVTFTGTEVLTTVTGSNNTIVYTSTPLLDPAVYRGTMVYECDVRFIGTPSGSTSNIRFFIAGASTVEYGFAFTVVGGVFTLILYGNVGSPASVNWSGTVVPEQSYKLRLQLVDTGLVQWYVDDVLERQHGATTLLNTDTVRVGPYVGGFAGITGLAFSNLTVKQIAYPDTSCYQPKQVVQTGYSYITDVQSKFGGVSLFVPLPGGNTHSGLLIESSQDFDFGVDDFTIEWWAYRIANTATGYLYYATMGAEFSMRVLATGLITLVYRIGSTTLTRNTIVEFPVGQWNFVAIQRKGINFECYLNDQLVDTSVMTAAQAAGAVLSSGPWYWGRANNASATTWNGYIDEIRVTRGVARYDATFVVPTVAGGDNIDDDPFFDDVVLLCHFDGADGEKTAVDSSSYARSPNSITGSLGLSTSFKQFGPSSMYFPSSSPGSYRLSWASSADFNISSSDFTIEMRVFELDASLGSYLSRRFSGAGAASGWAIYGNGLRAQINGVYADLQITSNRVPRNQWVHIALVRFGTELSFFIDGRKYGLRAGVTSIDDDATDLQLGAADNANENKFVGYIDEFRFTKAARYFADFDPPVSLPNCDSATVPGASPEAGAAALAGQRLTLSQGTIAPSAITGGSGELVGRRINLSQGFLGVLGLSAQVLQGRRMTLRQGAIQARTPTILGGGLASNNLSVLARSHDAFFDFELRKDGLGTLSRSAEFPEAPDLVGTLNWTGLTGGIPGVGDFYDVILNWLSPANLSVWLAADPTRREGETNMTAGVRVRLSETRRFRIALKYLPGSPPPSPVSFWNANALLRFDVVPASNHPTFAAGAPTLSYLYFLNLIVDYS